MICFFKPTAFNSCYCTLAVLHLLSSVATAAREQNLGVSFLCVMFESLSGQGVLFPPRWRLRLAVAISTSLHFHIASHLLSIICFASLPLGGPGLHDPCEREPTDALSYMTVQQKEAITHSAQVEDLYIWGPDINSEDFSSLIQFILCQDSLF